MPAQIDQWITLKDFSPGIKGRVLPANISRRPDQVLGVASPSGTFKCQALPDGGLGPMPKMTKSLAITPPLDPTLTSTGRLTISGYGRAGPIQTGDEGHIAFEARKTSDTKRYWYWQRIRTFSTDQVDTLKSFAPTTEASPTSTVTRPTYFDNMRAHATDATLAGLPGTVAGWYAGAAGTSDAAWHMFPGPATPTSDTPQLIVASRYPGPMLSHQGRSVVFNNGAYAHGGNSFVWTHNEDVYFTKANLLTAESTGAATYGAENASGYMAAISANHQELLAVKLVGGGILIRGDLNDPTVLRLPGLPSVTRHIPTVSPAGIVLLDALQTGAWLWSGGETAENISHDALDGEVFDMGLGGVAGASGNITDFVDFTGKLCYWYDWVLFPNNWAWNWKTGAWWRLEDPATVRLFQYAVSINSNPQLHGVPSGITASSQPVDYQYTYTEPATSYSWTSAPLPVGDNRLKLIREIVLVAIGVGNVTVTFTKRDGTTEAHTFAIASGSLPTYMRDNANVEFTTLFVQIDSTATTTNTPVVLELRMGISDAQHYPLRTA